jgi:hypothetical protein
MGAHALRVDVSTPTLGPFEKITSRITVRDIAIIVPPQRIPFKRMVTSVYWSGFSYGTLELAEHLCNYPKLLERTLRRAGGLNETYRIDFLGTKRDTWPQKGPMDLFPLSKVTKHPVLRRTTSRASWYIDWFSNLEYAKCLMVFTLHQ